MLLDMGEFFFLPVGCQEMPLGLFVSDFSHIPSVTHSVEREALGGIQGILKPKAIARGCLQVK